MAGGSAATAAKHDTALSILFGMPLDIGAPHL
jgi:hypothetical protein